MEPLGGGAWPGGEMGKFNRSILLFVSFVVKQIYAFSRC
jgi:hypothetical protein